MTLETVRAVLTPRTVAIVAVDLFGSRRRPGAPRLGLPVLEDAAQAVGASLNGRRAGSLGDVATFSFYPSKNLGAFGDGGAITTDDDEWPSWCARCASTALGTSRRSITSATTRAWTSSRRRSCACCCPSSTAGARAGVPRPGLRRGGHRAVREPPVVPAGAEPAWHLYVVTHPRADELIAGLARAGVQARATTARRLHRSRRWRRTPRAAGRCRSPTSWLGRTWPCR